MVTQKRATKAVDAPTEAPDEPVEEPASSGAACVNCGQPAAWKLKVDGTPYCETCAQQTYAGQVDAYMVAAGA